MKRFTERRKFMKSNFVGDIETDQNKGLAQPPLEKPYDEDGEIIQLPKPDKNLIINKDIFDVIINRKSHRDFKDEALSLEELSYLLWTTQGVKEIRGDNYATVRPVASAGARHPFETYLVVNNVEGLKKGLYRYLAIDHKLLFLYEEDLEQKITLGTRGQKFAGSAQVNFIWTCIPYRCEWRYEDRSHKVMLIDAGHVCQALYIACESLGLGNCAIAAYDQKFMDEMVQVDGEDEFVVYMSPVGRV